MNYKVISIYGAASILIGIVYGFTSVYFGFGVNETGEYLFVVTSFTVPFIISVGLFYLLSKSLEKAQYYHAIIVVILNIVVSYGVFYLILGVLFLGIIDLIQLVLTLCALCIGVELGKGDRSKSRKNA